MQSHVISVTSGLLVGQHWIWSDRADSDWLQACVQYMDSLQELEGILGSDTCSHLRNDPRLHSVLTNEWSNAACISKSSSVSRPLSANDVAHDVKKPRVTL